MKIVGYKNVGFIDPNRFMLDTKEELYARWGNKRCFWTHKDQFKTVSKIERDCGVDFIKNILGFSDYTSGLTGFK